MIKLIIFDLDGVLIDAKQIHFEALNDALGPHYAISETEHTYLYDGKKTWEKLSMLTRHKNFPTDLHEEVHALKQKYTMEKLDTLKPIPDIVELFKNLVSQNYKIAVCTNSIRRTMLVALSRSEIIKYCDILVSNEDVHNSKPHPEMYWKAMSMAGVLPEEVLIVEDSPPGILAAERSGANYIRVDNPYQLNTELVMSKLKGKPMKPTWKSDKLNVLIPMAGAGTRFRDVGYTFPKPLIDVKGKPMIQVVTENLGLEANFHFVVQKAHRHVYNLDSLLRLIVPNANIVEADGLTEGAACTALLAREFIDNDNPLFFANSDQFVEWSPLEFMYYMQETNSDGGIVTFEASHPKWSFAKVDDRGLVTEVAEKNPISTNATVGYYYWKRGSDFVKYADQMIQKNIRVNGEFYVAPVFNEAIQDGKKVRIHQAKKMWGLGVPEDLDTFINTFEGEV